jgi:uncharacterized membrane protein
MASQGMRLGNRVAPPRFLTFIAVMVVATPFAVGAMGWARGAMAAFDLAAIVFSILITPLLNDEAQQMRRSAKQNDANRAGLLVITGIVSTVVLAAVASELMHAGKPQPAEIVLIVGTLVISWIFSSVIYALHYAHMFYTGDDGRDAQGLTFPDTKEPDYWDFLYFSTCLSMTFQVSDMNITSGRMRRVVMFHCLAAFVFNLGIIAFTINVLGSS